MQPYFLPYIGYFQLMAAVDKFVIYDDVNFIKRGWVNRNRILLYGRAHSIVIPLQSASQNRRINEIELVSERSWRTRMLKTVRHAYSKAPQFENVFALVSTIVNFDEDNLSRYLFNTLKSIRDYLGIKTELVPTSAIYANRSLKGQTRILDICRRERASVYLNLSGGEELYGEDIFCADGVALRFLAPPEIRYRQFGDSFQPNLSIVDVLMFNPIKKITSIFLPT